MKTFECSNCKQVVFFENVVCERCASQLGYVVDQRVLLAFSISPSAQWEPLGVSLQKTYRPCQNYVTHSVCNWMVEASDPNPYCLSCRSTAMIPDLDTDENIQRWFLLEAAKRRLLYSLMHIGLPIIDRQTDPQKGLEFRFMADTVEQPALTGHQDGVITINIDEADDVVRERKRKRMDESYRTLLGHFRHEIGHYYWMLLVENSRWIYGYRQWFGDDHTDYSEAMDAYYNNGARSDWQNTYISEYATMHPWEDWAETWAHYLHIVDALDTASHWRACLDGTCFESPFPEDGAPVNPQTFTRFLEHDWIFLAQYLNSMNRSLGQKDSYPFVIPDQAIHKLRFIHEVVLAARDPH